MAEPIKETVHIALPQKPETTHGLQNDGAKRDTARILLPSRTPPIPPRRSPPPSHVSTDPRAESPRIPLRRPPVLPPQATASPVLHPLPKPAGANAIDAFDSTPRWFCWGLLGISALIFLIQIWNYALS